MNLKQEVLKEGRPWRGAGPPKQKLPRFSFLSSGSSRQHPASVGGQTDSDSFRNLQNLQILTQSVTDWTFNMNQKQAKASEQIFVKENELLGSCFRLAFRRDAVLKE